MGLSTGSAHLLFLTAQEYQKTNEIQRLTGQKRLLILQTEDATRTANAIRNTKHLVFSSANGENELTYGALMGEGAYNEGETDRYFIVDANDRLVLDSKTAKAAKDAGIEAGKKGSPNESSFETFMIGLGKTKTSSETWYNIATGNAKSLLTADDKTKLARDFISKYGSYPTADTNSTSISTLLEYMSSSKVNGTSLKDIYNGIGANYELYEDGETSGYGDSGELIKKLRPDLETARDAILKAVGQNKNSPVGKLLTEYIEAIIKSVNKNGIGNAVDEDSGRDSSAKSGTEGTSKEILSHWATSTKGTDRDHTGLRAQTALKRMLEIAIQYLKGNGVDGKTSSIANQNSSTEFTKCVNEKGYSLAEYEKALKQLSYIGETKFKSAVNYLKAGSTGSGDIPEEDTAKFYLDLFKQICEKGYTEDADVKDKNKIQAKLENGTYQIITNKDNYDISKKKNIDNSELGIYIEVIGGDEYEDKADAYLDAEKARIHREENDIDEQLTVRQSELTAIKNWKQSEQTNVMQHAQRDFQIFVTA